jgi:hypothetical protein
LSNILVILTQELLVHKSYYRALSAVRALFHYLPVGIDEIPEELYMDNFFFDFIISELIKLQLPSSVSIV